MAHVKMMLNVTVVVQEAKYLDCMPPGQFGSQLRLKGTINGEPNSVMYLSGKVWSARKSLVEAGVIGEEDFDEEPKEAVNVPLLKTSFVLTNKQVPGKNYGNIAVSFLDTSQKLPHSKTIYEVGTGLPGEDSSYLDAVLGREAAATYTGDSKSYSISADPMESVGKLYLECMKFVADRIVPIWEAGGVVIDASALNAATATLMIQRGKR